ncbi:TSUP family transporter [Rhodanobacter aciditrophus]|uniref:Probable membrane transporter protein n=1 Tax=Rhodanobacter aciditrophus TaxID=1623218 RepID=A0ABW4AVJ5_9GAMM
MDWLFPNIPYWALIALFATAFVAGLIDALAGGGGLITVPVLIATGVSPVEALATNKLQGSAGTLSSSYHFVRTGAVSLNSLKVPIIMTAIGSVSGTLLVSYLDSNLLIKVIPGILIGVAIFFWLLPKIQPAIAKFKQLTMTQFAFAAGLTFGFYDGLIGPGTGAFFSTAFICFMGYSIVSATAHTKVLNATSNASSLIIFSFSGHVLWGLGILMGIGSWLGAQVGSRLVISKGAKLIRPLVILMCIALSTKLLLSS